MGKEMIKIERQADKIERLLARLRSWFPTMMKFAQTIKEWCHNDKVFSYYSGGEKI